MLIPFELGKIWKKRSFALAVCVLLSVHVFLLWYTSLPDGETPALSSYRKIQTDIRDMDEEEKADYIAKRKETLDGILFVRDVLSLQQFQDEAWGALAEQMRQENPGMFEAYYDLYQSGEYLEYTDSLEQEEALIDEVYEEWQVVAGYGDYLRSIQENKDTLGGISIFGGQEKDTYSARNLEKSASDYEGLTDKNVRFTVSKGLTLAMESVWTDLLLFIFLMLFVGGLIMEEKEKKLFFITRSTKKGITHSMLAKLAALLIHCVFSTALFYTVSLVFSGQSAGWPDLGASLQSVAAYTQSNLPISILGFILISVMTKAIFLFGVGALLTALSILSSVAILPFSVGAVIAGIGALLYSLIPAGSVLSTLKYLNPVGIMKTEKIYGSYLNFNLFGYPVSRFALSLGLMGITAIIGTAGSLWLFRRMQAFGVRKLRLPFSLPFKPHTSIWRHEAYKIFIVNRALAILVLFAALLAFHGLGQTYTPSVAEQYYRDIMMRLEGKMTQEKENLVLSEKERYDEAFRELERIEEMASAGELSDDAAEDLKAQPSMTLIFYPAFERVERQYENIKDNGGSFVYDTGYLYLFGVWGEAFPVDFLILSVGILLAASGAISMEYQAGSLFLLTAAKAGKKKIFMGKCILCMGAAAVLALVPAVCRMIAIARVYPLHNMGAAVQDLLHYSGFALPMPIGIFVLVFFLSQAAAAIIVALIVLALSVWRKNQAQTVFFALLLLAVPMILKLLGFEIAKWFSIYPLYGWTSR